MTRVRTAAFIALLITTVAIVMPQPANAAISKHALAKVAKVAVAPVAHPKKSLKDIAGSIVFATEDVVDVAHAGLSALDSATSSELQALNYVIHPLDVLAGKADTGLEAAEQFFFGSSN